MCQMSFNSFCGSVRCRRGGCAGPVDRPGRCLPLMRSRQQPPAAKPVQVNRAARDTWTPVMDVLKASRAATVTEAQLQRLRELPLEAVWGALQNKKHVRSFEGDFSSRCRTPSSSAAP